ncbi:MAG: aminodeoxychorismate synthase component I [Methylococcales bacterium]|nr:aminodeoxychorismate synthase component I [Methylococcales bacterium]
MTLPFIQRSLPYFAESVRLFAPWARQPWAVFLDSGFPGSHAGRYDIIAAEPVSTLLTHGSKTLRHDSHGVTASYENPFTLVRNALQHRQSPVTEFPFIGGAIGYFGYDLTRRMAGLATPDSMWMADMAVAIYDWAVIIDHQLRQSHLVGFISPQRAEQLALCFSRLPDPAWPHFQVTAQVKADMPHDQYAAAFAKVHAYLREGDCYQINLTQRFQAPCQGDAFAAYPVLRELNAAPFSAFMRTPEGCVLSSSPERFLKLDRGVVQTKPIKGTRPRKATAADDLKQRHKLSASLKDRAENVMIVDLLRNDLSKSCRLGSVVVPELFAIESFATVHHLVSTVTGKLAEHEDALSLLEACFPGGSITGAPKIRAMQIIDELEPYPRGVYCGAIGYIGYDGNMDTNIAIRTLVERQDTIYCWAGGGIVHDSELAKEYQECFDKAQAMLAVLERLTA